MESKRFDALTRGFGEQTNRRGLLKGIAASLAAIAGVRAVQDEAGATGMARITIHNAQCHGKPKGNIYEACHDNGFGCVNFTFRGRTIRTNANGVASARIGAGSFAISQQASRVRKSSSVYVYCSDTRNGKVLYDGGAPKGAVSFHVPKNANVVCDWYNISKSDLSMPGQCPRQTTPAPTTTTTTTGQPCGAYQQECCPDDSCATSDLICYQGSCQPCGFSMGVGLNLPCCAGSTCNAGFVCDLDDRCQPCGYAIGQNGLLPCCPGSVCNTGYTCTVNNLCAPL